MAGSSYTDIEAQYGELSGTIPSQWGEDLMATIDDKLHMTTSGGQTVSGGVTFSSTVTFSTDIQLTEISNTSTCTMAPSFVFSQTTNPHSIAGNLLFTNTSTETAMISVPILAVGTTSLFSVNTGLEKLVIMGGTVIDAYDNQAVFGMGNTNWGSGVYRGFEIFCNDPRGPEIIWGGYLGDKSSTTYSKWYSSHTQGQIWLDTLGDYFALKYANGVAAGSRITSWTTFLEFQTGGAFPRFTFSVNLTIDGDVFPVSHETGSIGTSTWAWGEIYAKEIYDDDGTLGSYDEHDDLALIKDMQPWIKDGVVQRDKHGTPLIDYNSIPSFLKAETEMKDGSIKHKYVRPSNVAMFAIGAIKQLNSKVETLTGLITELDTKIEELKVKDVKKEPTS